MSVCRHCDGVMRKMNRRDFLEGALATGGALTSSAVLPLNAETKGHSAQPLPSKPASGRPESHSGPSTPIDFCFAPVLQQTAFCFPDDVYKSLVTRQGELLYGYKRDEVEYFPLRLRFGLDGMDLSEVLSHGLESPGIPIVKTVLQRDEVTITLTTFATDGEKEGRVDNVWMEIKPRSGKECAVAPLVFLDSERSYELHVKSDLVHVVDKEDGSLLLLAKASGYPVERSRLKSQFDGSPRQKSLELHPAVISTSKPYQVFIRLPQAGQRAEQIEHGLDSPQKEMEQSKKFWQNWSPLQKPVQWEVGGRQGEFLTACARNILQAREVKDGKLTFQVGPTCYRGLWVVDGNFILEAARYLGYDKEAVAGLRTTWSKQQPSGQIIAAGGPEHYKDTAIAMFTLVRQCELSQEWSLLRELEPQVLEALQFLESLLLRAKEEKSALGRYGLLPRGFADGGFDETREELTNTVWTLAGLKAISAAANAQNLPKITAASAFNARLLASFHAAAAQEMREYNGQFRYLPMLLKEDPLWQQPNPWDKPRPQCAQWALSHTIFPGRVFEADDPVLQGHVKLMQAVSQEAIPAETGWSHHEAVWTYNAAFVAEVYLWLGMKQEAHDTFIGFLNHASPNYCWREEQSLQHAMVTSYVGDMPHNWASAECIRYLRHSMALEDGERLRLLAGVTFAELETGKPVVLKGSPTRFGRIALNFEPLDQKRGWRLSFEREAGPEPAVVTLPSMLGRSLRLQHGSINARTVGESVEIDGSIRSWSVSWKA